MNALPPGIWAFPLAFLIGAIPCSYLYVKFKTGEDIRKMGSGNPGATNVFRSIGKTEGLIVLAGDFLKGLCVPIFLPLFFPAPTASENAFKFLLGLTAIGGHVFSPFLHFKGGKGMAVGAGMTFAVFPVNFLLATAVWFLVLILTQYMSLASIIGAYVFAISSFFTFHHKTLSLIALGGAIFITWTHRSNIRRLIKGEETKTRLVNKH